MTVLREKKDILLQQIKNLNDLRDAADKENDQINIKLEVEKDELQLLQRQVLHGNEIAEKLEECMKSFADRFKELKFRDQQFAQKLEDQNRRIFCLKNDWEKRISGLKSKIDAKKSLRSNTDDADQIKKENLLLKAQLLEKRKRLEDLQQQYEENKAKKSNLDSFKNIKLSLEDKLNDLNRAKQEFESLKLQNEKEMNEGTKNMELILQEKQNRYELKFQYILITIFSNI